MRDGKGTWDGARDGKGAWRWCERRQGHVAIVRETARARGDGVRAVPTVREVSCGECHPARDTLAAQARLYRLLRCLTASPASLLAAQTSLHHRLLRCLTASPASLLRCIAASLLAAQASLHHRLLRCLTASLPGCIACLTASRASLLVPQQAPPAPQQLQQLDQLVNQLVGLGCCSAGAETGTASAALPRPGFACSAARSPC